MSTTNGSLRFAGISLEQYAGVSAALADEIPLADVLSQEGITEPDWKVAQTKWREVAAEAPDVQMEFVRKYAVAEDVLTRKVPPVDTEPEAWSGLSFQLREAAKPMDVLKPLGLRAADLSRLGRLWKKKAQEDPGLVKKLNELAGKAPPPSGVKAEPSVLKPFPWTKGGKAALNTAPSPVVAPAAAAASPADKVSPPLAKPDPSRAALTNRVAGALPIQSDIDLYAAVTVAIQLMPGAQETVLGLCGIDAAQYGSVTSSWQQKLGASQDLRATFAMHSGEHRAALRQLMAGARGFIPT